eukprot:TRINITY_DN25480_c0_g1_i1.p1 TRINITY_DN25480_c0_g1~~TRINITY_DN25480_c0_g1_i1.p1  ORF type:complete len:861 (+),score=215.97 TRINITY_DN25480_c0_g1_i1:146-2584(+)
MAPKKAAGSGKEAEKKAPGKDEKPGKDGAGKPGAAAKSGAASGKKEAAKAAPAPASNKASKAAEKQSRAAAEAARRAAVDDMMRPPSDSESEDSDRPCARSGGQGGGGKPKETLAETRERQKQEKEALERTREEARQRREERLAEKEREKAEKESQKAEKAGGDGATDIEKILNKVETVGEKKLSNKERRLYAKHLQKQAEEEHDAQAKSALAELSSDEVRVREAVKDFSVSIADDSTGQAGAVDLRLEQFSVSVGSTQLFNDASLTLAKGRRYGFLGPNGQGKTSLLRIIAAGRLPVPTHWRVGLVEQEAASTERHVVDEVLASDTTRQHLLDLESGLLAKIENFGGGCDDESDELAELCRKLAQVGEDLEASGAEAAEGKVRQILCGLAFTSEMVDGPVSRLSGGWRMRVSLAKALFLEPDLLLLDEPTNHLDLDAVLWLDDYLNKYPKTLFVVSHDADFLDSVCTDVVHLEEQKLNQYRGGYTQFKKAHAQRVKEREKEVQKQQEEKKKGKKVTEDDTVTRLKDYVVKFKFLEVARDDEMAGISVHDATFSYTGKAPWLLKDLNFRLDTSTRITIVGVNGSGKSTLLGLVAKTLEPCKGEVQHTRKLTIGRYSQHFDEIAPHLHMSAVEFLTSHELRRFGAGTENPELAHKCLGQFGLPSHAHRRPMKELSGGQKARVCFASITCRAPELLVLDEPTNHLDIESVEALIDALRRFRGGLLLVTHDARLIQATECELRVCYGSASPELGRVASFDAYRKQVLTELAKRQAKAEAEAIKRAAARRSKRESAIKRAPKGVFAPPPRVAGGVS